MVFPTLPQIHSSSGVSSGAFLAGSLVGAMDGAVADAAAVVLVGPDVGLDAGLRGSSRHSSLRGQTSSKVAFSIFPAGRMCENNVCFDLSYAMRPLTIVY